MFLVLSLSWKHQHCDNLQTWFCCEC